MYGNSLSSTDCLFCLNTDVDLATIDLSIVQAPVGYQCVPVLSVFKNKRPDLESILEGK